MNLLDKVMFLAVLAFGVVTTLPFRKSLGRWRCWLLLPLWVLVADRWAVSGEFARVFLFLLVGIAAVLIVWQLCRDEAAARLLPCQCRHCGYDLTGNVSGRCPECGDQAQ